MSATAALQAASALPTSIDAANTIERKDFLPAELEYIQYEHSLEKKFLPSIRALIAKDLSEPYSIYVYRYFLYQWGDLCFMVGCHPHLIALP